MANPFGRSVIVPLTNQSGGSVAAGDLVYLDTAHDDSFTTGTTSAYTGGIGIAQQAIASLATGLVLVSGYASLVNVNASVTRGHFGKSYTVAKQATDAGASRVAGTFCVFLTGGTTPDAVIWQPDLGTGGGSSSLSGAKAYNSTTQALTGGSTNAFSLDSEEYDSASYHSTVTNTSRMTVPTTGSYLLTGGTYTSSLAVSGLEIGFRKNGTTSIRSWAAQGSAGWLTVSTTASLTAGDYVELCEFHASGSITFGHASGLDDQTNFSCVYLGF